VDRVDIRHSTVIPRAAMSSPPTIVIWTDGSLQALAYGVYSRDTSQYDERIRACKLK
jgi:hypothetical protein